ncbi:hypothetical protein P879_01044 [Paragonimus westermani]|uniref:N(6)-L-threonylcarbamoyladenine synthase n=1 Tax=Paragonimus westermani TaxID=34504 RepID=A0A8T0DK40_9TREM|nr:hypothetical protein P879_01044 [Paragonimus westermani]
MLHWGFEYHQLSVAAFHAVATYRMLPFASHQHPLLKRLCSSAVRLFFRTYSTPQLRCVLGLESSCDDTGVAVISVDGKVLSEKVASQTAVSVMLGGVLPTVARGLHEQKIRSTTNSVLFDAGISWKDIGSIAVTVKPGMPLSLKVGVAYAKELAALHKIPLIPVHHMEAHALTATLTHPELRFPYLVLLLSGGHGLLALARGLEDFLLLGTALDASPGDVLEKLARRMKLSRLGDNRLRYACGGRAIELMAAENVTDPHLFDLPSPRSGDRDCDFSFTGIHVAAEHVIKRLETEQRGVPHFVIVFHYSIMLSLADLVALSSPSRSSSHI